jgi:hypothetical protein
MKLRLKVFTVFFFSVHSEGKTGKGISFHEQSDLVFTAKLL